MADDAIRYMKELNASAPDKPFLIYYVPGATLLSLLDGKNGNDYGNNSTDIQKIVGVRTHPEQRDGVEHNGR